MQICSSFFKVIPEKDKKTELHHILYTLFLVVCLIDSFTYM